MICTRVMRAKTFGAVNSAINHIFQHSASGRTRFGEVGFQKGDVQAIFKEHPGANAPALEAHHQE